jgi:hypothetical protein
MNIKIPGYTLYGNYYLADKIIPVVNFWKALRTSEEIKLPNSNRIVIARVLSAEEIKKIKPKEKRSFYKNGKPMWYYTSTTNKDGDVLIVVDNGNFYTLSPTDDAASSGGVRLGFKNPFLHSDEEDANIYHNSEYFKSATKLANRMRKLLNLKYRYNKGNHYNDLFFRNRLIKNFDHLLYSKNEQEVEEKLKEIEDQMNYEDKEVGLVYKDREFQKINNKNTIKEEILEIYNKCFNY